MRFPDSCIYVGARLLVCLIAQLLFLCLFVVIGVAAVVVVVVIVVVVVVVIVVVVSVGWRGRKKQICNCRWGSVGWWITCDTRNNLKARVVFEHPLVCWLLSQSVSGKWKGVEVDVDIRTKRARVLVLADVSRAERSCCNRRDFGQVDGDYWYNYYNLEIDSGFALERLFLFSVWLFLALIGL